MVADDAAYSRAHPGNREMTKKRVLGIDPGDKRIGVAISDETATLARPLRVIKASSREGDAEQIRQIAEEYGVGKIIVGQSLDEDGKPSYQGRRARRLAGALAASGELEVVLWDEAFSTKDAGKARLELGATRERRKGHMDDAAASMILQDYLDATEKARNEA